MLVEVVVNNSSFKKLRLDEAETKRKTEFIKEFASLYFDPESEYWNDFDASITIYCTINDAIKIRYEAGEGFYDANHYYIDIYINYAYLLNGKFESMFNDEFFKFMESSLDLEPRNTIYSHRLEDAEFSNGQYYFWLEADDNRDDDDDASRSTKLIVANFHYSGVKVLNDLIENFRYSIQNITFKSFVSTDLICLALLVITHHEFDSNLKIKFSYPGIGDKVMAELKELFSVIFLDEVEISTEKPNLFVINFNDATSVLKRKITSSSPINKRRKLNK